MTIRIGRPDDWHVHLRQGDDVARFAPVHAVSFGRVLAMPNTLPPLVRPEQVLEYRRRAEAAAPGLSVPTAFRLMPDTTAQDIAALAASGVPAGKYYPDGATTGSAGGLKGWRTVAGALSAMEEHGLVLCIHGEEPGAPVLERESAFLPAFREMRREFPGLKMILEHVSSAEGVRTVLDANAPTAATVTVQHLLFTLDDLIGGHMDPHLFCKPVVKTAADRRAIRDAVFSGDPRLFFGSDSAPHPRAAKEGGTCAAGAFTAPMALPALAAWFDREEALDRFEPFVCVHGRRFYGMEPNSGSVILERREWTVPRECAGCVPLMAGRPLPWRVASAGSTELY